MHKSSTRFMTAFLLITILLFTLLSSLGSAEKGSNPALPDPPIGLQAKEVNANSVTLTWQDQSKAEDGFNIYMSSTTDNSGNPLFPQRPMRYVGSNVTEWTVTHLMSGGTYYFRITAFNKASESKATDTLTVTLSKPEPKPKPPEAPVKLTLEVAEATTALSIFNLAWQDTSDNESGFRIYTTNSSDNAGNPLGFKMMEQHAPNTTKTTLKLDKESKYWFRVLAFNEAGESLPSNYVVYEYEPQPTPEPEPEAKTNPPLPAPTNLRLEPGKGFQWDFDEGSISRTEQSAYGFLFYMATEISPQGWVWNRIATLAPDERPFLPSPETIEGHMLMAFKVTAYDGQSESAPANILEFYNPPPMYIQRAIGVNLHSVNAGETEANLTWSLDFTELDQDYLDINSLEYTISWSETREGEQHVWQQHLQTSDNSIEIPGLERDKTYYFQVGVFGRTQAGTLVTGTSQIQAATTLCEAPPQPTALTVSEITRETATVSWAGTSELARYYVLRYGKDRTKLTEEIDLAAHIRTTQLEDLEPETEYYLELYAVNRSGHLANPSVPAMTTFRTAPIPTKTYTVLELKSVTLRETEDASLGELAITTITSNFPENPSDENPVEVQQANWPQHNWVEIDEDISGGDKVIVNAPIFAFDKDKMGPITTINFVASDIDDLPDWLEATSMVFREALLPMMNVAGYIIPVRVVDVAEFTVEQAANLIDWFDEDEVIDAATVTVIDASQEVVDETKWTAINDVIPNYLVDIATEDWTEEESAEYQLEVAGFYKYALDEVITHRTDNATFKFVIREVTVPEELPANLNVYFDRAIIHQSGDTTATFQPGEIYGTARVANSFQHEVGSWRHEDLSNVFKFLWVNAQYSEEGMDKLIPQTTYEYHWFDPQAAEDVYETRVLERSVPPEWARTFTRQPLIGSKYPWGSLGGRPVDIWDVPLQGERTYDNPIVNIPVRMASAPIFHGEWAPYVYVEFAVWEEDEEETGDDDEQLSIYSRTFYYDELLELLDDGYEIFSISVGERGQEGRAYAGYEDGYASIEYSIRLDGVDLPKEETFPGPLNFSLDTHNATDQMVVLNLTSAARAWGEFWWVLSEMPGAHLDQNRWSRFSPLPHSNALRWKEIDRSYLRFGISEGDDHWGFSSGLITGGEGSDPNIYSLYGLNTRSINETIGGETPSDLWSRTVQILLPSVSERDYEGPELPSPTGVRAFMAGQGRIKVMWDKVPPFPFGPDIDGYNISTSLGFGENGPGVTLNTDENFAVLEGFAGETRYTIRVQTWKRVGDGIVVSAWSAPIVIHTPSYVLDVPITEALELRSPNYRSLLTAEDISDVMSAYELREGEPVLFVNAKFNRPIPATGFDLEAFLKSELLRPDHPDAWQDWELEVVRKGHSQVSMTISAQTATPQQVVFYGLELENPLQVAGQSFNQVILGPEIKNTLLAEKGVLMMSGVKAKKSYEGRWQSR